MINLRKTAELQQTRDMVKSRYFRNVPIFREKWFVYHRDTKDTERRFSLSDREIAIRKKAQSYCKIKTRLLSCNIWPLKLNSTGQEQTDLTRHPPSPHDKLRDMARQASSTEIPEWISFYH